MDCYSYTQGHILSQQDVIKMVTNHSADNNRCVGVLLKYQVMDKPLENVSLEKNVTRDIHFSVYEHLNKSLIKLSCTK